MSKDDSKVPFDKEEIEDIFELVEDDPPAVEEIDIESVGVGHVDDVDTALSVDDALDADSALGVDAAVALEEDIYGDADEVVLSADDHEFTPAAVALNKDEFEAVTLEPEVQSQAGAAPRRGVLAVLLAILRIPENAIKTIFRFTPFYRLLSRSRRYQNFERGNAVSPTLGNSLGMPRSVLGRLGHFMINNVLVTCALVAGVAFGGLTGFTELAELNTLRELVGLKHVDDGTATMAEARQTRSFARVSSQRRDDVIRDLDHCSVTENAREQILASVGADGRLNSGEIQKSFGALKRFRETFATKGIADEFEKARTRRALISEQLVPHLESLQLTGQKVADRIAVLQREAAITKEKMEALEARAQRKTVVDINQQIKLRDDLAVIEAQLAEAPTEQDIAQMFVVMQKVQESLAGAPAEPLNLAETESLRTPEWIHNISFLSDEELRLDVQTLVEEKIGYGVKQLDLGGWPVVTYYVNVITLSVNHIVRAIDGIDAKPKKAMRQLDRLQSTMNQLIDEQFKLSKGVQWINYRGCLNANQIIADADEGS